MLRSKDVRRRAKYARQVRAAVEAMEVRVLLSTISVNTFEDRADNPGSTTVSLRDAMALAASRAGADTINIPAGKYTLGSPLQANDQSAAATLQSIGGVATLDGNDQSGLLFIDQATILIRGLAFVHGSSAYSGGITYGGAVTNFGTLTLTDCTIAGNTMGVSAGIYSPGTLTVINSTISGNAGDGIENSGTALVENSTISGNVGIGISSSYQQTVLDCTIANNQGGGVRAPYAQPDVFQSPATFTCANSIIAGNSVGNGLDVFGSVISKGHNLIGQAIAANGFLPSDQTGNEVAPLDARLSPLGNFGGATQTMVPMAGSPALGAGAVALVPKALTTDQRGLPRMVQGKMDVGSVQTQPPARILISAPAAQSFAAGKTGNVSLGSFAAPGIRGPFFVNVDWGDGTSNAVFTMATSGSLGTLQHVFARGGTLAPSIAVTDSAGDLSNGAAFSVKVATAAAVKIVVNTVKDQSDPLGSATVSLPDAIDRANHATGPVSIVFDSAVFSKAQTIKLEGLELGGNSFGLITITGPAARVTLDDQMLSQVLRIDRGVTASITSLTMTDGYGSVSGGGIENHGVLTLTRCEITGNSISGEDPSFFQPAPENGGGIANFGELTLADSTISGNTTEYASGAGLYNCGVASVRTSTFTGNAAQEGYRDMYGRYGGAIANLGLLTITNSTLSANSADAGGGGIENRGSASIYNSTITDNSGEVGGINNPGTGQVKIANSIVAQNIQPFYGQPGTPADVSGAITSLGHNLVGAIDGSSGWKNSDLKGSVAHPLDPHLSPLDFWGGSTQTQFPLAASPALGEGATALLPSGATTDQRGYARVAKGILDIGAVELQRVSPITITPPARQSITAGDTISVRLGSFTDPAGNRLFHVIVNWGDGSSNSTFTLADAGALGTPLHRFITTGSLTGTIYVRDAAGDISSTHFSISAAVHPLVRVTVNSATDVMHPIGSSTISLGDAFAIADQAIGPVSIAFDPKVFATLQSITLKGANLSLTHNVFGLITIKSPIKGLVIVGQPDYGAVLNVGAGVAVNLSGFALQNGGDSALKNAGAMIVNNCTFDHSSSNYGGGIDNSGTLTLTNSDVFKNFAVVGEGGRGSRFGGYGEGIYNSGTMTITGCSITDNGNDPFGANGYGVYNDGTLAIDKTTISDNAGGAYYNSNKLTITDSTISGNIGGPQ